MNRKFDAKKYHRYNDLVLPLKLQSTLSNNRFSGKMRSAAYRMLLICAACTFNDGIGGDVNESVR